MNLHLTSHGKGKPLVFFHGWGFDSQVWSPLIPLLQERYQLILVDLPGFGMTDMMDWELYKSKLLAQLPEQFIVAGWSLGGLYASRLAIEAPLRVSALINIASSPLFINKDSWPGVSQEVFRQFYKNLFDDAAATLKEFTLLQLNKKIIDFSLGRQPSLEGLASGLDILGTWDLRAGLKELQQPACFMFGRLDPITPLKIMHSMQLEYPHFEYVLFPRAAHMPFLSHMDLFISHLNEFIQ